MTLDALRLEVPDIVEEEATRLGELNAELTDARRKPREDGLQRAAAALKGPPMRFWRRAPDRAPCAEPCVRMRPRCATGRVIAALRPAKRFVMSRSA